MFAVPSVVVYTTILSLCVSLNLILEPDEVDCNTSESCVGQHMDSLDTFYYFTGYKAGFGPSTSVHSTESITCSASMSCNSMQYIKDKYEEVECTASHACANTVINTIGAVYCRGYHTCSNTTFVPSTKPDVAWDFSCHGLLSCSNAYIAPSDTLYASGQLALMGATIDSQWLAGVALKLSLQGSNAGYGATLVCSKDRACYVSCETLDACTNFTCTGRGCIMQGAVNATDNRMLQLWQSLHVLENTDSLCVYSSANFDDYGAAFGILDLRISPSDVNVVCCRGCAACASGKPPYDPPREMILTKADRQQVICSADTGCAGMAIMGLGQDGVLYCESYFSCMETNVTVGGTVFCFSDESCESIMLTSVNTVLCGGEIACQQGVFRSGSADMVLYFTGFLSGSGTSVTCDEGTTCEVYCIGQSSCDGCEMSCNGNCKVQCDDTWSGCPKGDYERL